MSINKNTIHLPKADPADTIPFLRMYPVGTPLDGATSILDVYGVQTALTATDEPWSILSDGIDITMREASPDAPIAGRATWNAKLKVDPKTNGLNRTTLLHQRNVLDELTHSKVLRLGQARVEFTSSNLAPDSERLAVLNDLIAFLLEPAVQDMVVALKPIMI